MRVLDRPSVSRNPGDDTCGIAQEAQSEQAGTVGRTLNAPNKQAKGDAVAGREVRRQQSVFGACAIITGAECDCSEPRWIADRHPRRKSNFDRLTARAMDALQACWQRCRIVCDDEVATAEEGRESSARQMLHPAIGGDGEEFSGSPVGTLGSNHEI